MKPNIGQGDEGKTHLPGGKHEEDKVWKDSPQVEACGELDELNSYVGFLRSQNLPPEIDPALAMIQDHLFRAEFHISAHGTPYQGSPVPAFTLAHVTALEKELVALEKQLPRPESFILPGGTEGAALAHVARTISRRAERRIITWMREVENPRFEHKAAQAYLNRLSDYFFALARHLNNQAGTEDIAWVGREKKE